MVEYYGPLDPTIYVFNESNTTDIHTYAKQMYQEISIKLAQDNKFSQIMNTFNYGDALGKVWYRMRKEGEVAFNSGLLPVFPAFGLNQVSSSLACVWFELQSMQHGELNRTLGKIDITREEYDNITSLFSPNIIQFIAQAQFNPMHNFRSDIGLLQHLVRNNINQILAPFPDCTENTTMRNYLIDQYSIGTDLGWKRWRVLSTQG
ncbi:hypothetical protein HGA88_05265 [Candidatus Roizmanbacteria bacterium]|nr:hypothetical protein [Candidatus Roizmanbacteria bacterium]